MNCTEHGSKPAAKTAKTIDNQSDTLQIAGMFSTDFLKGGNWTSFDTGLTRLPEDKQKGGLYEQRNIR